MRDLRDLVCPHPSVTFWKKGTARWNIDKQDRIIAKDALDMEQFDLQMGIKVFQNSRIQRQRTQCKSNK